MPIVDPVGFDALGLIGFQINPHYIEGNPPGHQGETRAERLKEFLLANPDAPVLGLPEGCRVEVQNGNAHLRVPRPGWWFKRADTEADAIQPGSPIPPEAGGAS